MPEQLTVAVLQRELAATEQRLETKMATVITEATEPHFKAINTDLLRIEKKVDTVLSLLHDGDRIDEIERRVRKLAELAGVPEFTLPIRRPLGA